MTEAFQQYLHYARMVWSFRWVALATAFVLCIMGWMISVTVPDRYEVVARVFLDTRSMLRPVLKGLAVEDEVTVYAARVMNEAMLSAPNLEAVARSADLHLKAKTQAQMDGIVSGLRNNIVISNAERARENIYYIKFTHSNPVIAHRVVEALLNRFVESVLGNTRTDTETTKRFLTEQISEYETRLVAAEERLKDFKTKHGGLTPAEGMTYFDRLGRLEQDLEKARLELKETINRRNAIRRQMAQVSARVPAGAGQQVTLGPGPLEMRVREAERELKELELRFTDQHPDVQNARRILADLEAEQEAIREALARGEQPPQVSQAYVQNPVYIDLNVQLSAAEGQVVTLETRVAEYDKRVQRMRDKVDTIPEIEAEFAKLNRDYAITKQQYETLVQRREQTEITEEAGTADDLQFRVLEPPRLPQLPVGPNRLKITSATLVGAIGGGIGLAFLLSQLSPRIYTREQLKNLTDYPVLGSVSMVYALRQRLARRFELLFFGGGVLALFGLYGALALAQVMRVEFLKNLIGWSLL